MNTVVSFIPVTALLIVAAVWFWLYDGESGMFTAERFAKWGLVILVAGGVIYHLLTLRGPRDLMMIIPTVIVALIVAVDD